MGHGPTAQDETSNSDPRSRYSIRIDGVARQSVPIWYIHPVHAYISRRKAGLNWGQDHDGKGWGCVWSGGVVLLLGPCSRSNSRTLKAPITYPNERETCSQQIYPSMYRFHLGSLENLPFVLQAVNATFETTRSTSSILASFRWQFNPPPFTYSQNIRTVGTPYAPPPINFPAVRTARQVPIVAIQSVIFFFSSSSVCNCTLCFLRTTRFWQSRSS